eukprot:jgi/Ulvmu1/11110/UM070_0026.1
MYQVVAAEDFVGSAPDVLKALGELDNLRVASGHSHARCGAQNLCAQLKNLCQTISAASLPEIASVIAGCCDLRTEDAQSDIGVLEDAVALLKLFPGLLQSKHVLDHAETDKILGVVMRSVCNGVLPRLYSIQAFEELKAVSAFDRLLESGFAAMQCITDCTATVCHSLCRALPEGNTDGFSHAVSCVCDWITALVHMGTQVVATSRVPGIPNELRTGKTLTKTWHELLRAVDASPEGCRHYLGPSANGALSLAWRQLMASLEVFMSGPVAQAPNNERLYRFWVQKCAHVANSVPSSIGELAEPIWRCTHGAYAISAISRDVAGLELPHMQGLHETVAQESLQHQQMIIESVKKHLLPRMLACALPALSVMPQAVLHLSLQDLAPQDPSANPPNVGPLAQFIRPDTAPAAAQAGGHALMLKVLEELPRVDPCVRDACASYRVLPALCSGLRALHSTTGSAAVTHDGTVGDMAAGIGQWLHACVSCMAGGATGSRHSRAAPVPEEQLARASGDLLAVVGLCGSISAVGHEIAAGAAQHVCRASPACAAPLGELLVQETRRRCECAALAQGAHAFAEHWLAAVACAMVAMRILGEGAGGAIAALQDSVRHSAAQQEALGNPVECILLAAGLAACELQRLGGNLAGGADIAQGDRAGCGVGALLSSAEQRRLFEQACDMLPWVCEMAEATEGHTHAMVLATAAALTLLLAVMAGALLPLPGETGGGSEGGLCFEVPETVCRAAVTLCDGRHPAPARCAATMLLTAACEAQTALIGVTCVHDALSRAALPAAAAGLAARALTAAACHPDCTPQQHAASLPLWRALFSDCAAHSTALAAAMRWFAVFARVFPSDEYTEAVPPALLRAPSTEHGAAQPGFLQLLRTAQLRASEGARAAPSERYASSSLLLLRDAMAAGPSDAADSMGEASASGKHARAACLAAALQSDLVSLASGTGTGDAGVLGASMPEKAQPGDRPSAAAAAATADGRSGCGSAAERRVALGDVLNTLRQLQAAEAREGGPLAGGLEAACQELQALVQAAPSVSP